MFYLLSGNKVRVLKKLCNCIRTSQQPIDKRSTIWFELSVKTDLVFSVNDENDNILTELAKGELEKGVHVYRFDTTTLENGNYYLNFKSSIQNINEKLRSTIETLFHIFTSYSFFFSFSQQNKFLDKFSLGMNF